MGRRRDTEAFALGLCAAAALLSPSSTRQRLEQLRNSRRGEALIGFVLGALGEEHLTTSSQHAGAHDDELPACRDLCFANCFCLGFSYKNASRACRAS